VKKIDKKIVGYIKFARLIPVLVISWFFNIVTLSSNAKSPEMSEKQSKLTNKIMKD
jgi:hypothetical protein